MNGQCSCGDDVMVDMGSVCSGGVQGRRKTRWCWW